MHVVIYVCVSLFRDTCISAVRSLFVRGFIYLFRSFVRYLCIYLVM